MTGSSAADRHRDVSAGFTARVQGASDWDAPAPVPGWRARDVVAHLVEWFPDCLTSAAFRHPFVGELRSSGHYGPRVAVPDGSDAPTRMLAFIGRDPLRTGA